MRRVRALLAATHPGPCLAVTALAALLAAQAAPHGTGPVAVAPAMLAGQLSVGWSNDAIDADRDAAAHRTDKPIAQGLIGRRTVWACAVLALVASLALSLAISPATLAADVVINAAAWAYNLGLKSTPWSGLTYAVGAGSLPAFATSTLPGHPLPRWWITVAAAAIGLGAHFANVLPDLVADRLTGVSGLPQRVAARWGSGAVRAVAITLLLLASAALLVAARPARRWVAVIGLVACCILAVVSARGRGRVPFGAAIGIAVVDVLLLGAGVTALT
jgi:4-hydroxybenzoate polyprenyltransferase